MRKKLPLGAPYALAFRVLRPMRRLRGTPCDVFGWDRDRRTERAIIGEYERLMDKAIAEGMPYERLVQLAESALSIKGYGPVKEAAVDDLIRRGRPTEPPADLSADWAATPCYRDVAGTGHETVTVLACATSGGTA
jgi:hypothetical protein